MVSLCRQQSSVIHMHVDPSCLLQRCPAFEHISGLFLPHPPFFVLYVLYHCSWCPFSPLRGDSWLGCQDLPAMGAVSWMSGALNLRLAMLLLISGKLSLFSLVLLAALGLLVTVHFRNKILCEAYSASFTLCFLLSVPFRLELHKRLLLPQNRPLLRSSNKYLFNNEQQQGNVSSGIN